MRQCRVVQRQRDCKADQGSFKHGASGATVPYLDIELAKVEEAISHIFGKKGADVVELNLKALQAGYEQAKK